jgi:hypothetical protein
MKDGVGWLEVILMVAIVLGVASMLAHCVGVGA